MCGESEYSLREVVFSTGLPQKVVLAQKGIEAEN